MANRCTLHKDKLDDFKQFLNDRGIAYRPGRGAYQALQVFTELSGWQCIHSRADMPEHYTVQDKLMPLVRRYLEFRRQKGGEDENG